MYRCFSAMSGTSPRIVLKTSSSLKTTRGDSRSTFLVRSNLPVFFVAVLVLENGLIYCFSLIKNIFLFSGNRLVTCEITNKRGNALHLAVSPGPAIIS